MIIIADSHMDSQETFHEFFEMLGEIQETDHDVFFIGDIFELWIGMRKFENSWHDAFVQWCMRESKRRVVGFVEGNHEFFVTRNKKDSFSVSDPVELRIPVDEKNRFLLAHGDGVNLSDKRYLFFRKFSDSWIAEAVLKLSPFSDHLHQKFFDWIRDALRSTNTSFKKRLPWRALRRFAENAFESGVSKVFLGHFHKELKYEGGDGRCMYLLPAWGWTKKITVVADPPLSEVLSMEWPDLLKKIQIESLKIEESG